jgi:putative phosphoesterase
VKIGLVSDTHVPGARLPQTVVDALQGVDMILHAGDLVTLQVLDTLGAIAPVAAVHGNMDSQATHSRLPLKTVVEAEGKRIGLLHGDGVPQPNRVLAPPIDFTAIHAYLVSQFGARPPDCIVYGHTHQAHVEAYRGVLVINPGSATRGSGGVSTVGLLVIENGQIEAAIVELPTPGGKL